jgi:hypothetical protein
MRIIKKKENLIQKFRNSDLGRPDSVLGRNPIWTVIDIWTVAASR